MVFNILEMFPTIGKLGFPHKTEVALRSFPVCVDSLRHAGSLL